VKLVVIACGDPDKYDQIDQVVMLIEDENMSNDKIVRLQELQDALHEPEVVATVLLDYAAGHTMLATMGSDRIYVG
jgi:hypothetical protein